MSRRRGSLFMPTVVPERPNEGGLRGTACAKFLVLIVSLVGVEIELDRGPISYVTISQECCGKCPLWVISGHLHCNRSCPLYPRKRTYRLPISQRCKQIKIKARLPEASNLSELDNHRFRISAGRTLKRPLVVIILFGRSIFERNIGKPHFALLLFQILAN